MIKVGFNFVTIGADQRFMSSGAREAVSKMKSQDNKKDSKTY